SSSSRAVGSSRAASARPFPRPTRSSSSSSPSGWRRPGGRRRGAGARRGDAPPRDGSAGLLRPEPFVSSLGGVPLVIALLLGAALAWILWRRWYWATRHARHTLGPVLLIGGASLVLLLVA